MKFFPITLIVLFLSQGIKSQIITDSLTLELNKCLSEQKIAGFGVSLFKPDTILYLKSFGFASIENKLPYTSKTVQPIASISKTLIAVSLMKAQELGLLKLDDDINKYLPFKVENPHFKNEVITIRHLATHTSGIKDRMAYEKNYVFDKPIPKFYKALGFGPKRMVAKKYYNIYSSNEKMSASDFLFNIYNSKGKWYKKGNFMKEKPGTHYEYSNNGANLAALIIQYASGMEYTEFVNKYILKPIKMDNSGWSLKSFAGNDCSSLYFMNIKLPYYEFNTIADGGLVTNISDFTRYMQTMMKGYKGEDNVISAASYKEMFSLQINPTLGTGIFWDLNKKSIGHTGGDPGVSTIAVFNSEKLMGYIIFMNTSDADVSSKKLISIFQVLKKYANK